MFYGREMELKQLHELYQKPGFQMPVIYGRRRVGKTRLIQEFCRQKKCIFFVAIEQNDKESLRMFSEAILLQAPSEQSQFIDQFASWEAAFRYLGVLSKQERWVLVIDEYPYLASGNKSLPSILQNAIDHVFLETQLFLILCGSSMSFMENQVLDYKSPLYGRRTAQFKIRPLDYLDSIKFFQKWKQEDQLYGYAVAGGIPQYLLAMSQYRNFKTAVVHNFLSSSGSLYEEPMNLMKQEMREPAVYNSIIKAIAKGASRQIDISNFAHEDSSKTANYLRALLDLEIIEKKYPLDEDNKRKTVYMIKDNMYQFWYKFIPDAMSLVEMGMSEEAYDRIIEPGFSQFFGFVFEDICRQYLIRENQALNLRTLYHDFGSWWGTNPVLKIEEEIDIVASNKQEVLFAECKWKSELVGIKEWETLLRRSSLTQKGKDQEFWLFSKSGFSKELQKLENGTLHLVVYDMIFAI